MLVNINNVSKYEGKSPFKIIYVDYTNELDGMGEPIISFKTKNDETFDISFEEWIPG